MQMRIKSSKMENIQLNYKMILLKKNHLVSLKEKVSQRKEVVQDKLLLKREKAQKREN